jgi:CHAT domain-containing protein/Tfp pilus assembly protein PilF
MRRVSTPKHVACLACLAAAAGVLALVGKCRHLAPAPPGRLASAPPAGVAGATRPAPMVPAGIQQLVRGTTLRRRLAAGETHAYRIHLPAGSFLRLVVDQQGSDAELLWSPPGGRSPLDVDSPNGTRGPELLTVVAPETGDYRLDVRGVSAKPGGAYGLRVEQVEPATAEDRQSAAALLAFSAAERLRLLGRARPLRAAIPLYEEALAHWRLLGERERQALALRQLGKAWFAQGELRRANTALAEALSLTRELGLRDQEARLLNDLAPTFRLLGEHDRSVDCSRLALRLAQQEGDRLVEVTAINNLGVLYDSLGETQTALTFFDRALTGWRQLNDAAREADTLQNLGGSYTLLGHLDEALALLDRALVLKRQAHDRRGQAAALSALGWARYLSGDLPLALAAYDESLRLRQETGDQRGEANTLDRRATVLSRLGEKERALASYEAALGILQRVGDRLNEAQVLASIGFLDESRGLCEMALSRFDQALSLFRRVGDQHGEAYALMGSARAARRLGRPGVAQSRIEAALRIVESVHGEVQNRVLRTSYLASRQDYYELYIQILMERASREPGMGWEARALEISDRARARELLASMAEAEMESLTSRQPALAAAAHALEARIHALEERRNVLLGQPGAGQAIAALERELRDRLLAYDHLAGRILTAGLEHTPWGLAPALAARDIQRLLDPDTLLLWYQLGDEGSFLWVVGAHSLTSHALPPRPAIETAARKLHELLQESHLKGTREQAQLAAAALGDVILKPAARELGHLRLLIAGDGALQYVSFAVLPTGFGAGAAGPATVPDGTLSERRPLVADHEIVRIPSAAVLALIRRELRARRSSPGTLAVVADPVFRASDPRVLRRAGAVPAALVARSLPAEVVTRPLAEVERAARDVGLQGFDRLPWAAVEAAAILALVPPAERWQALGFQANRARVTGGALGRYRIVHFATHGLLDARHPELSGLVLSLVDELGRPQDGFLRVHDLARLAIPADLVVLSACRTALGQEIRGEGLVGLTQAFLRSGAARVLVSLWSVNDRATSELMERFYRRLLKQGLRPAAALRDAQLSMLGEPRWSAPAYWAGFTLQGEWR